ncbi:MAG: amino acid racemase [Terracidiphilus sp.]|jgi:aspartate racemase
MDEISNQRCLGLIGGLGVGATIHYYRELVKLHEERRCVPDLLIAHADVNRVLREASAGDTRKLAAYLSGLIDRLYAAGAQIAAIPAVTPHICAAELLELSPIPIVSLPGEILREIQDRRLQRVALFGTRFTMESRMFGQLPGVEVVVPRAGEVDLIHEAYVQIVNVGHGSEENYQRLRDIAHTLCEREKVEAIVLGGTELSLLFNETNTDFPHIDGARVHLAAIMRELFAADAD